MGSFVVEIGEAEILYCHQEVIFERQAPQLTQVGFNHAVGVEVDDFVEILGQQEGDQESRIDRRAEIVLCG